MSIPLPWSIGSSKIDHFSQCLTALAFYDISFLFMTLLNIGLPHLEAQHSRDRIGWVILQLFWDQEIPFRMSCWGNVLVDDIKNIRIEACLFNEHFYKASHSKVVKERALHVHQTKTKHFIAKLFAQPVDSWVIFSICMLEGKSMTPRRETIFYET